MYGNFQLTQWKLNCYYRFIKGKLVLMHVTEAYGRVGVYIQTLLTSPPDGCEWSPSRPGH
jgi:hypothetical protein